jgi:hypothetical protein
MSRPIAVLVVAFAFLGCAPRPLRAPRTIIIEVPCTCAASPPKVVTTELDTHSGGLDDRSPTCPVFPLDPALTDRL